MTSGFQNQSDFFCPFLPAWWSWWIQPCPQASTLYKWPPTPSPAWSPFFLGNCFCFGSSLDKFVLLFVMLRGLWKQSQPPVLSLSWYFTISLKYLPYESFAVIKAPLLVVWVTWGLLEPDTLSELATLFCTVLQLYLLCSPGTYKAPVLVWKLTKRW